jgi:hypothetical protein
MAKLWSNFYPYIQPFVPGCPEVVIESHLQEAAAEYIGRSEIWRFEVENDFTSKNTADYEIDVPTGAILENILVLYIDGQPVKRVTDRHYALPNTTDTGSPSAFTIYQDAQIKFFPTPDKKYTFSGVGTLKPSLSATGVEDFIFETHGRSIACGAIHRLCAIPGKEWSNPEVAMYYKNEFYKHMEDAKGRDTRRVNMRVAPQGFDRATKRRGM